MKRAWPARCIEESVNVAGTELASTPLNVPSRTLGAGASSRFRGASSELSGFLSLVADFIEQIPAITPDKIEPAPSPSSDTTGVRGASRCLNDLNKDPPLQEAGA